MLQVFSDPAPKREGQAKMIWEKKPWIRHLASRKTSGTLLLYASYTADEPVLSLIAAHVIQSARHAPTASRMIVLHHFCRQNIKNGSKAVVSMVQSLLYQLLAQLDESRPFGMAQFSCTPNDLCHLTELFESVLKSLHEASSVICVIDCLDPYCERSIDNICSGEARSS
jgi:hypothetical protein